MVNRRFVVLAPDLHDGAGVVLCNPERRLLLAQLRAEYEEESFDDGEGGCTAMETASRIAGAGACAVSILAGPRDQRAARILHEACVGAGLDAAMDVVFPVPMAATSGTDAILRIPAVRRGDQLRRWIDGCRAACNEHGNRRVRLAPRPLEAVPSYPSRRAPLPADLDLDDPEWRAALITLVAECWPRNLPPFLAVLGACDLGSNPLEDAYAGLGLRERNAELLVNIVDHP